MPAPLPNNTKKIRPCCLYKYPEWIQDVLYSVGAVGTSAGTSQSTTGSGGSCASHHHTTTSAASTQRASSPARISLSKDELDCMRDAYSHHRLQPTKESSIAINGYQHLDGSKDSTEFVNHHDSRQANIDEECQVNTCLNGHATPPNMKKNGYSNASPTYIPIPNQRNDRHSSFLLKKALANRINPVALKMAKKYQQTALTKKQVILSQQAALLHMSTIPRVYVHLLLLLKIKLRQNVSLPLPLRICPLLSWSIQPGIEIVMAGPVTGLTYLPSYYSTSTLPCTSNATSTIQHQRPRSLSAVRSVTFAERVEVQVDDFNTRFLKHLIQNGSVTATDSKIIEEEPENEHKSVDDQTSLNFGVEMLKLLNSPSESNSSSHDHSSSDDSPITTKIINERLGVEDDPDHLF
uniref:Uncharacterized protein n=1 Tax=Ditylenchus dipsaci TaxID=166011 RepID=A0A915D4D7_9BILA